MNIQILLVDGLTLEEIEAMELDTADLTAEDIDRLIKEKKQRRLEANKNSQKVVMAEHVENWLTEGWEFVSSLRDVER
jgi:site-specific recombinase XerC